MKVRRTHLAVLAFVLVNMALANIPAGAQTTFTFTQLDVPGSTATEADGINAQGEIVGFFFDAAGRQHGFLKQGGSFTQLDFPGATATRTANSNNAGVIAGAFTDAAECQHGMLGRANDLPALIFPAPPPLLAWASMIRGRS